MDNSLRTYPIVLPPDLSCRTEASAAFANAEPVLLEQGWLSKREEKFRPATVYTGWGHDILMVYAELEDDAIYSEATGLNDRTWEKGDVFEIFLRNPSSTEYQEFHITPTNAKLQLRIPSLETLISRDNRHAVMGDFMLKWEAFQSRVWLEESRWFVLAAIPFSELQLPGSPHGSQLSFSFSPRGNPPALLGDSQSLTAPGAPQSLVIVNRSKFTIGDKIEAIRNPETHDMGMQVSCCVYPEVPSEGAVRGVATGTWKSISRTGETERMRNRRGSFDARSRTHVDIDSAEVCGFAGDGLYQGQKRDPYSPSVWWTKTELCGPAFLGERVLGVNGRQE